MPSNAYNKNAADIEAGITLKLLNAVEADSNITQRTVAREMGVALGLANAYIKRCVKKGLIKIHQAPTNRYAYYLTPRGFAEKGRLTAEYLTQGFQFFRISRAAFEDIFAECAERGWTRIAVSGLTDLTEIAVMEARRHPLSLVAIIDAGTDKTNFDGIPVVSTLITAPEVDVIIVADIGNPQLSFERLSQELDPSRILTPRFLNISRNSPASMDVD